VAVRILDMTTSIDLRGRWLLVLLLALTALGLAILPSGGASGEIAQASAAKTVSIKGFAFKPATVRVQRGARVAFVNADKVTHTATRAGSFDTKRIKPGESETVHFNRRGVFRYHCKIHSFMRGKVVVE
jgi:plastocyanin